MKPTSAPLSHSVKETTRYATKVCFHGQQCAEKYLKALMQEAGLTVPRTHQLISLLPSLMPFHPSLRSLRRGLDYLTRFAVDTRYPGDRATKRQAVSALRWMEKVWAAVRPLLDIRPPRAQRKK